MDVFAHFKGKVRYSQGGGYGARHLSGRVFVESIDYVHDTACVRFDCNTGSRSRLYRVHPSDLNFNVIGDDGTVGFQPSIWMKRYRAEHTAEKELDIAINRAIKSLEKTFDTIKLMLLGRKWSCSSTIRSYPSNICTKEKIIQKVS